MARGSLVDFAQSGSLVSGLQPAKPCLRKKVREKKLVRLAPVKAKRQQRPARRRRKVASAATRTVQATRTEESKSLRRFTSAVPRAAMKKLRRAQALFVYWEQGQLCFH